MTLYQRPSFTVPAGAPVDPATCGHGWLHAKTGRCVFCGMVPERPAIDQNGPASEANDGAR